MFTSKQYRTEAMKFRERADQAGSPADKQEFRALERSFDTLAENAEWVAENGKNIVPPPSGPDAAFTVEEEHILRCLGAALIMQWNTLPTKHQRELFEIAADIGDTVQMSELRARIARFLHTHKNGDATS